MTDRLYYDTPPVFDFTARLVAVEPAPEGCWVELDRTAFYPESGGQRADGGTLAGLDVLDVQEDGARVRHRLARAPAAAPGAEVAGRVDAARRGDHMQQHSGQHLLSAAFVRLFRAETVSFHMGARDCTIDLAGPRVLDADALLAAEDDANAAIAADLPVAAEWCARDAAPAALARKVPAGAGPLRLVRIGDYDVCACCGTHVARSAQVGMIALLAWEKAGAVLRVRFACGRRVLDHFRRQRELLRAAARVIDAAPDEVPRLLAAKVEGEKRLKKQFIAVEQELLEHRARAWYEAAPVRDGVRMVLAATECSGPKALNVAGRAVPALGPAAYVLIAVCEDRLAVAAGRAPGVALDTRAAFQAALAHLGGKGGGPPEALQGGAPAGGDVPGALAKARAALEG